MTGYYFHIFLSFLIPYLIGSIPSGLLLMRFFASGDPRKLGSGNIGATNIWRAVSKKQGFCTFLADTLKGTFAVLLVSYFGNDDYDQYIELEYIAAFAVVIGHIAPLYLRFRGGKGVSTCFGVMLAFSPLLFFIVALVWLFMLWISHYASLSSIVTMAVMPIISFYIGFPQFSFTLSIIAIVVVARHRQNIIRIIQQKEPKIGTRQKKS